MPGLLAKGERVRVVRNVTRGAPARLGDLVVRYRRHGQQGRSRGRAMLAGASAIVADARDQDDGAILAGLTSVRCSSQHPSGSGAQTLDRLHPFVQGAVLLDAGAARRRARPKRPSGRRARGARRFGPGERSPVGPTAARSDAGSRVGARSAALPESEILAPCAVKRGRRRRASGRSRARLRRRGVASVTWSARQATASVGQRPTAEATSRRAQPRGANPAQGGRRLLRCPGLQRVHATPVDHSGSRSSGNQPEIIKL